MVTPIKGDFASIPINREARKIGDAWDPAKDEAAGLQCKAYGAPAIMRAPGRVHITWQDDNTLKLETDEGTQTRLFHFAPPGGPRRKPHRAGKAHGKASSVANWERAPRGVEIPDPFPIFSVRQGTQGRSLEVLTTNLRPGYLRKNGVPYSAAATVNEYYDYHKERNGDEWFTVTTIVRDPQYSNRPLDHQLRFQKRTRRLQVGPVSLQSPLGRTKMKRIAFLFALTTLPISAQVDFTGEWAPAYHEDGPERLPGPELGDYMGIPLSDAGRLRADSYDADRISVVTEYQCRPHSSDYGMRGLGNLRVTRDIDISHPKLSSVPHLHARLGQRPHHLDGRPPASPRLRRTHLSRFLHRRVGRQHANHHHHAPQSELPPPQRSRQQRQTHRHRTLDPPRRFPNRDRSRRRPRHANRTHGPQRKLVSRSRPENRRRPSANTPPKFPRPSAPSRITCPARTRS